MDSYPLNVDFNEVKPGDLTEGFSDQMDAATVGFHQRGDTARKISYIIPADHEFSDRPADSANENHRHRLAFAAVSATEIGGIVLNDTSDEALETTKQIVLEAVLGGGVYYPVISGSGELLLTPEEFASRTSPLLDEPSAARVMSGQLLSWLGNLQRRILLFLMVACFSVRRLYY